METDKRNILNFSVAARKWFLLTYTRAEDRGYKQLFKELNKSLKSK